MAGPGFCTVVAKLADPKFLNEIRCSSINQYFLKENYKKIFIIEGFAMLQTQFFILHFFKLVSEIKPDFIRKFWFNFQQMCYYGVKSWIRYNSDLIK